MSLLEQWEQMLVEDRIEELEVAMMQSTNLTAGQRETLRRRFKAMTRPEKAKFFAEFLKNWEHEFKHEYRKLSKTMVDAEGVWKETGGGRESDIEDFAIRRELLQKAGWDISWQLHEWSRLPKELRRDLQRAFQQHEGANTQN